MFLLLALACSGAKDDSSPVDADGDGALSSVDCDDEDATVHPGADELCDGVDQDCDDEIDEGVATAWYTDADGDGFGDPADALSACEPTDGRVADATDCDDADPAFHPGADEADCTDPNDYNCDGSVGYKDDDGDGYAACAECDDTDAAVHPDATEVCNGVDDDCDDTIDEGVTTTFYADDDADGWGNGLDMVDDCAAPDGYVAVDGDCDDADAAWHPDAAEDCADPNDYNCDGSVGYADDDADGWAACSECDDADPTVHPDATETCNAVDDDCDGTVDETDAVDAATWYLDADGDGYGSTPSTVSCGQPAGYVATDDDCDDTVATTYPGAPETCDGVDDDCDGTVDEDDATDAPTWYADSDGDGYGDPDSTTNACDAPTGYVADDTDCDDAHGGSHPGADEWCDGIDSDCDDLLDEDAVDTNTWYTDADSDAFGDPATATDACEGDVLNDSDCDDTRPDVSPVGTETCNGLDDDCDGTVDDGVESTFYADTDGDGYGDPANTADACAAPAGYRADATDCDDTDAAFHPGASDVCGDPADYNCDGSTGGEDADGDGVAACEDCDDTDAARSPDAAERCNGVDDDCDGTVDEADAVDAGTLYVDGDGDGYGGTDTTTGCAGTSGVSTVDSDCDDADAAVSPAATEVCNGIDDDCEGTVDGGATTDSTYYADRDGDGYGDPDVTTTDCMAPSGYVADDTDCDDTRADTWPGAPETEADGVDQDCDGAAEQGTFTESQVEVALDGTYYDDVPCAGNTDFNQDGLDDWAFGNPNVDSYRANYGSVNLYYGSTRGDATLTARDQYISSRSDTAIGTALATGGDLTGDGFPDLLIGAANPGGTGVAGIQSGTITGSSARFASDGRIRGATRGDGLGWSVAILGDENGDGDDDVLVGAPGVDTAGTDAGAAYLFHGPFSSGDRLTTAANATILGDDAGDALGREVALAGDVDGDGVPDVALGIPEDDTVTTDSGGVWLFLTPLSGTVHAADADAVNLGDIAGDFAGTSVAPVGDLDGDGYDDLFVGVPGTGGTGWAAILPGPITSGYLSDASTRFLGVDDGDEAGYSVASLGDRDGDGVTDLGVGAPGNDLAGADAGAVYVIFGPASGTVDLGDELVFTGDVDDRAGTCVANGGDVDADGNDDLLVVGMQTTGVATGWVMLAP